MFFEKSAVEKQPEKNGQEKCRLMPRPQNNASRQLP
jgi:hypothetical protein